MGDPGDDHLSLYHPLLHGDLTDDSNCNNGVLEIPGCNKIGGQATQAVYEITVLEVYAKITDLTKVIKVASGVTAQVADFCLADTAWDLHVDSLGGGAPLYPGIAL